MRSGMTQTAYK
jgi:hypothetical protein